MENFWINDIWILLTGILVAIPCCILGCFLVLRKMVMVGDAISHAVLPGIVITYLITRSFNSWFMLIGATFFGILTTLLIEFFHKKGKLQEDASIGVTFTWLFALGIILISSYLKGTDLDLDCVLYGEILNVPFNRWITNTGLDMGPIAIYFSGFVAIIVLVFLVFFFKELFITTFDAAFAKTIGINVNIWHFVLMGIVSFVTVSAFDAVGAILVVAFLSVPAATAYLLTDNFKTMISISCITGIVSVIGGYYFAVWIDASAAGCMTCFAGFLFILSFFFSPKHGYFTKIFNRKREQFIHDF